MFYLDPDLEKRYHTYHHPLNEPTRIKKREISWTRSNKYQHDIGVIDSVQKRRETALVLQTQQRT